MPLGGQNLGAVTSCKTRFRWKYKSCIARAKGPGDRPGDGAARNTIRAILAGKSDCTAGVGRAHQILDAHKGYLQERIEAAGKIRLPAMVAVAGTSREGL